MTTSTRIWTSGSTKSIGASPITHKAGRVPPSRQNFNMRTNGGRYGVFNMKTVEAVGKNSCELLDRVERGPSGMVGASHTRVPPHAAIALVNLEYGSRQRCVM